MKLEKVDDKTAYVNLLVKYADLEKENAKLKEHHKSVCETLTNTHRSIREQLTKATDLLKKMYYLYFDPCVTEQDLENRDKLFEEVKQFLKEIEK